MKNDLLPDFRLELLGPPMLRRGEDASFLHDPDKPYLLLFLLAATQDGITRAEACDILWPGVPQNRARASLSTALYTLSARLETESFPKKTRTSLFWNLPSDAADIRQVLFPSPPDGCARIHPAHLCDSCRKMASSRLFLLSRPFLQNVRIPKDSPFSRWAEKIQRALAEVKAATEREIIPALHPPSANAEDDRAVELRPLTALVLRLVPTDPLPDDELLDRLEPVRHSAEDLIRTRGGFVVPSSPDTVTAYFGFPRCRENEGRFAADCARKLLAQRPPDPSFSLSVGLHSGLAPCDSARGIPDPFGRLSEMARTASEVVPAFSLAATESSALLLQSHFRLSPIPFTTPPLFLVEEGLSVPDNTAAFTSGIFGRESELSLLRRSWEETRYGKRRTIWLEGEAGIGKSALLSSFVKEVKSSGAPHNVREYFCLPEHQGTPWAPIIRSIRRQTGLDEPFLSSSERTYRLERYLLERERPVEKDLPLLRHLLGEKEPLPETLQRLSPDRVRETLETFLLDVISHLSRSAPLLLVMEDVHWADQATLALVKKSFERMGPISMTMILSCRDRRSLEVLDLPLPDTMITLSRLDRQSARRLVSRAAGRTLSAASLRRILDMGEGIPLYLRELAMLARDEELPLPPTLNTLFASRTDTLPLRLRQILPSAAALGITFQESLLRLLVLEPQSLETDLEELCHAGLLDKNTQTPLTYSFHHALLREAVLASLSAPGRRATHSRIADLFASRETDIPPEDLAFHLEKAGRVEEAVPAYRLAAKRASAKGATSDASLHLSKALSLVRSNPRSFPGETELSILLEAGPLAVSLQGHGSEKVAEIYARAAELADTLPDTEHPFPLRFGLWTTAFTRVGPSAARPLGEDLRLCAQGLNDPELSLRAEYALGGTLFWTGELALSKAHLLSALKYAEESRRCRESENEIDAFAEDPEMGSRAYLSWVTGISEDPEEGLREAQRAIRRAEGIGHPNSLGYALAFDCYLKMLLGDPKGAGEVARRSRELAEQYGYLQWEVVGQVAAAFADGTKESLTASRMAVEAIGTVLPGLAPLFTLIAAMTALKANEPEIARTSALRGLDESKKTGARAFDPELFRIAGEGLLLSGGSPEEAADLFLRGVESANLAGSIFFAARSGKSLLKVRPGEGATYQKFLSKLLSGGNRV